MKLDKIGCGRGMSDMRAQMLHFVIYTRCLLTASTGREREIIFNLASVVTVRFMTRKRALQVSGEKVWR
jgi:hypothetical protein